MQDVTMHAPRLAHTGIDGDVVVAIGDQRHVGPQDALQRPQQLVAANKPTRADQAHMSRIRAPLRLGGRRPPRLGHRCSELAEDLGTPVRVDESAEMQIALAAEEVVHGGGDTGWLNDHVFTSRRISNSVGSAPRSASQPPGMPKSITGTLPRL